METTKQGSLGAVADHPAFVLGAYFFAFVPWGVMNNYDFISEKWRSIRETRNLACVYSIFSIIPLFYAAVYAEAQRQSGDIKELAAALTALFFNVINFSRTQLGVAQAQAFVRWCMEAMKCMHAIQGLAINNNGSDASLWMELVEDLISQGWDLEPWNILSFAGRVVKERILPLWDVITWKEMVRGYSRDVDDSLIKRDLMVNNTIIDNEFEGTDMNVVFSFSWKIWWELSKGPIVNYTSSLSRMLSTHHVKLCTVRWAGAYLCGIGKDWRGDLSKEKLTDLYSSKFKKFLSLLANVTWTMTSEPSMFCLDELTEPNNTFDLRDGTAYRASLKNYRVRDTFRPHTLELESLCSSYPSNNEEVHSNNQNRVANNREHILVELVDCVLLAKVIGPERLFEIRQNFNGLRIPSKNILESALNLLGNQCNEPIDDLLEDVDIRHVPIFPYRMQMVALWDNCTNWRVLQASIHADNASSLQKASIHWILYQNHESGVVRVPNFDYSDDRPLTALDLEPSSVFDNSMKLGLSIRNHSQKLHRPFIGIVIETVRTFLAEWMISRPNQPNWDPYVPLDPFTFTTSDYLAGISFNRKERLVWESQNALQKSLAVEPESNVPLPSDKRLIMLFLLGSPVLSIEEENENLEMSTRRFSARIFYVSTSISLKIVCNENTKKISLSLMKAKGENTFDWRKWIDGAMGYMMGYNGDPESNFTEQLKFRPTNLDEPVLNMRERLERLDGEMFLSGEEGTSAEGPPSYTWLGWPPFDYRICKFEVDQWMVACNMNWKAPEESIDKPVRQVIEAILLDATANRSSR